MIIVRKTNKYSINIYLNGEGIKNFIFYIKNNLDDELKLDNDSIGFDGKKIDYLKIVKSNESIVSQFQKTIFLEIEEDDIEYLEYKLNQFFIDNDFIPEELFNLKYKNKVTINFYLTKIENMQS